MVGSHSNWIEDEAERSRLAAVQEGPDIPLIVPRLRPVQTATNKASATRHSNAPRTYINVLPRDGRRDILHDDLWRDSRIVCTLGLICFPAWTGLIGRVPGCKKRRGRRTVGDCVLHAGRTPLSFPRSSFTFTSPSSFGQAAGASTSISFRARDRSRSAYSLASHRRVALPHMHNTASYSFPLRPIPNTHTESIDPLGEQA